MITEDQLEHHALQWFQDTGWDYLPGAKRLECVELAPAFGAPTLNDSASKLDALQTLRVNAMPILHYVSVFTATHIKRKPAPTVAAASQFDLHVALAPSRPGGGLGKATQSHSWAKAEMLKAES
jgi:hypothetical protein